MQRRDNTKIIITGCSGKNYWYHDKIGQEFDAIIESHESIDIDSGSIETTKYTRYRVGSGKPGGAFRYINYEDATDMVRSYKLDKIKNRIADNPN